MLFRVYVRICARVIPVGGREGGVISVRGKMEKCGEARNGKGWEKDNENLETMVSFRVILLRIIS